VLSGVLSPLLSCSTWVSALGHNSCRDSNTFTVWYTQGDYLYTVLVVAFGESIKSATRISSLYSFVSVLSGTGLGLIVIFVRRLKAFIICGTVLFMVAFGLLIRYRGGGAGSAHAGVIGAQFLLGFGKPCALVKKWKKMSTNHSQPVVSSHIRLKPVSKQQLSTSVSFLLLLQSSSY
jgi:hypothetical protein